MAAKKIAVPLRKRLEAEHDKLLKQRDRLRAEIERSKERQTRTLRTLSQFPEVVEALNGGLRPAYMDAETWADLQAFVAKR